MPSFHPTPLAARLHALHARIDDAVRAAGRPAGSVRLIGVTKTVDADAAAALVQLGCVDLGENRPEELVRKAAHPGLQGARWHVIGTFQRRKVRDTLAFVHLIHSVHSRDLLAEVAAQAARLGRPSRLLLQVNMAAEPQKQGFAPADVAAALEHAAGLTAIEVVGLMCMAPEHATGDDLLRIFGGTRELRDRLATRSQPLPELSMGMSGDFPAAIRQGSTMVRVGSALFPPAPPPDVPSAPPGA